MAGQFDLYRMGGGQLVVVLQSDLLDRVQTRVVAPLVPAGSVDRIMSSLNPVVTVGEASFILMPQLAATLTRAELGERIGSLAMMRDDITRAVDALLSGI